MAYRKALGLIAIGAALAIWSGGAVASSDVIEKVQNHLYAGQTAEAAAVARGRLAEAPGDDQARFALGAIQFLQSVEHLGQALHRYGLSTSYSDPTGLAGLPILRLPVPENPNPEKVTYEAFRGVLAAFVVDLSTAEQTLSSIKNQAIDFPLNIGLIRLDLNADGTASDEEALWRIFKRVAGFPWLDEEEAGKLLTDFDESDVPWLQAYSHLLMAIAEFPLAHDWRNAFETTFHSLFPNAELPSHALAERDAEWRRNRDFQPRYDLAGIADLIAFVHLNHWPVVEPDRMRSVLEHLEAMVRLSRESWRRIMAETDDRNEWIPSPRRRDFGDAAGCIQGERNTSITMPCQSGVLPRMQVTENTLAGWMLFLDEFEALLQGKKLLPHWRFDQGINLRRMFLEPSTFDIVLLLQGSAALPYLEDGELTAGETWEQIADLFGGDFFRYFIWFN